MFYTIASRLPYIVSTNSKKFFKIFLVGSILYILAHYYLFSGVYNVVLESFKHYLYYIMGADLVVAYIWSKLSRVPETETIEYVNEDNTDGIKKRSANIDVLKQIAELKSMQQQQENEKEKSQDKTQDKSKEGVFKKDENTESEIPLFKPAKKS